MRGWIERWIHCLQAAAFCTGDMPEFETLHIYGMNWPAENITAYNVRLHTLLSVPFSSGLDCISASLLLYPKCMSCQAKDAHIMAPFLHH